jgi:hypothetical protein
MEKFTDKALKFFFEHIRLWIIISFLSLNFGSFTVILTIWKHEMEFMEDSLFSWFTLFMCWTFLRILKYQYDNKQLFKD